MKSRTSQQATRYVTARMAWFILSEDEGTTAHHERKE